MNCDVKKWQESKEFQGRLKKELQELKREQEQEKEMEQRQKEGQQEANYVLDYILDVLNDINSGNLKSVVEFLDREIENLRFIFDSCVNHGIEMEELANETVFHVSDLAEIRELAVLLTEIRYSLLLDGFEAREKLKKILIERAAVGKRRLLALVL